MLDRREVDQFRNRVKSLQDELDSFAKLFEEALQNQAEKAAGVVQ